MGRGLGFAIVLLLATGCATRGAVDSLEQELARVRADLVELRHAQWMSGIDLLRVQSDLRQLDSRAAGLQEAIGETAADVARLRAESAGRPVAPPTAAIAGPGEEPWPGPATTAGAAPVPPASSPDGGLAKDARAGASTPEREYELALATFRAREHGQAVLDFVDFIARHPKHPLAVNAQYWIAEAYYAERDWRHALIEFQKVLEIGPGTPKAGDALVKMGSCHVKLNDVARARATWQRVVREHPRTEAASKARTLLAAPPRP